MRAADGKANLPSPVEMRPGRPTHLPLGLRRLCVAASRSFAESQPLMQIDRVSPCPISSDITTPSDWRLAGGLSPGCIFFIGKSRPLPIARTPGIHISDLNERLQIGHAEEISAETSSKERQPHFSTALRGAFLTQLANTARCRSIHAFGQACDVTGWERTIRSPDSDASDSLLDSHPLALLPFNLSLTRSPKLAWEAGRWAPHRCLDGPPAQRSS